MSVIFKQYGAMRTGTNVLRAALVRLLPEALVLMHVLGDKHSFPSPLGAELDGDPVEMVWRFTLGHPASTTDLEQLDQRHFVSNHAGSIVAALAAGSIVPLISVRDPYSWAASWLRFCGLGGPGVPGWRSASALRTACISFNRCYAAWLAPIHCLDEPMVVRLEDLRARPQEILARIVTLAGRDPSDLPLEIPRGSIEPCLWDHHAPREGEERVAEPEPLRPRLASIVTKNIDWELLSKLRYRPRT